uniref:Uncharacterized protein n=1 Tax=Oryza punctata TaxID=4537 RepID=A0A0E0ME39_ORYPU
MKYLHWRRPTDREDMFSLAAGLSIFNTQTSTHTHRSSSSPATLEVVVAPPKPPPRLLLPPSPYGHIGEWKEREGVEGEGRRGRALPVSNHRATGSALVAIAIAAMTAVAASRLDGATVAECTLRLEEATVTWRGGEDKVAAGSERGRGGRAGSPWPSGSPIYRSPLPR